MARSPAGKGFEEALGEMDGEGMESLAGNRLKVVEGLRIRRWAVRFGERAVQNAGRC